MITITGIRIPMGILMTMITAIIPMGAGVLVAATLIMVSGTEISTVVSIDRSVENTGIPTGVEMLSVVSTEASAAELAVANMAVMEAITEVVFMVEAEAMAEAATGTNRFPLLTS
jgi:hypothetical protein